VFGESPLKIKDRKEVIFMINLSNGHRFEYIVASGALGYDGRGWPHERLLRLTGLLNPFLFTIVTKTLTLSPCKGNLKWFYPFGCVKFFPGGVLNAVGLSNPGLKWWCEKIGPKVNSSKIPIIVSIFGEPEELKIMATMLNDFDLVGLEINASCPNIRGDALINPEKIVRSYQLVKSVSRFPVLLKLSAAHSRNAEKITKKTKGLVEALTINSVPWGMVFPALPSPLKHLGGGGLSGKLAQHHNWLFMTELKRICPSVPVVGPSVWNFEDIARVRGLGADAISFGAIFLRYPWRPTMFVKKDMKAR
jgi:dihydroorotate dehydrogenase (NAD+) catalytic subunit